MTGRKCSTCKHYEPAPIWRKGWCRNPLLYSPQQDHLVGEDDLDCERGMGNYWEPADLSDGDASTPNAQPLTLYTPSQHQHVLRSRSGYPVYPVSGSSGYDPDDNDDLPPVPARGGMGGGDRELGYYANERYWTDYLRIIAPIVGVILIIVLFWFWANKFLGGDDNKVAGTDGTPRATLPVITASATPSTAAAGATPSVPLIVKTPPVTAATATTAAPPSPSGGSIAIGATVQVANTGGTGVNMRSEPSTSSDVVDVLLDGTQLTVIDGPTDAEGYTWWQVQGDAGTGWLVGQYLQVSQ